MKKQTVAMTIVLVILFGVAVNVLWAGALVQPGVQPVNTPASPEDDAAALVRQVPDEQQPVGDLPVASALGQVMQQAQPNAEYARLSQQPVQSLRRNSQHILIVNGPSSVSAGIANISSAVALTRTEVQPTNTPAPVSEVSARVQHAPAETLITSPAQMPQVAVGQVLEQARPNDEYVQRALQHAQALQLRGQRFQPINSPGATNSPRVMSATAGEICQTLLQNSALNVTEYGDGTGTVEAWTILDQILYYSTGIYRSANYSLKMMDETDGSDTVLISSTLDYDQFGQGFYMPAALTSVRVNYSTWFTNTDSADHESGNLWTLNSQGNLDQLIALWPINGGSNWVDAYAYTTDPNILKALGGKPVAVTFDMDSNRTSPAEAIYLDDIQVRVCSNPLQVYLPLLIKQPPAGPVAPTCSPLEPDSKDQRGTVDVGGTCSGSFSVIDLRDYYTVRLNGATSIRLQLSQLPAESNWDALLYEDVASYPLVCHIATSGSQTKYVDCPPLNLGKTYFILVNAGVAPKAGANTYQLSVINRAPPGTPTPTPTATATTPPPVSGIYGQVRYNGNPIAGINLVLRYYDGSAWSTWGSAVATDASGNYRFTGVPSLGSGQKYYVYYANGSNGNADNSNYLASWLSFLLTSYTAGANVLGGNFDIADVTLASPSGGSSVTLPHTFTWNRRTATTTDNYEFDLFDPTDEDPWVYVGNLGYVNGFTLNSLPTGFSLNTSYGWSPWVYGPDGGGGASYWYRTVTFVTAAANGSQLEMQAYPNTLNEAESLRRIEGR
jgi:hypothetical protein